MTLKVVDRFTTHNGSWEPDNTPFSVTQIAAAKYAGYPAKGAANHIHVKAAPGTFVEFNTSDGKNPVELMVGPSGWVNLGMTHDASYNPDTGAVGPWGVWIGGQQIANGIGLPYGWHVATFLVVGDAGETDPTEPPVEPPPSMTALEAIEQAQKYLEIARGLL
jgi:hypothetical protein